MHGLTWGWVLPVQTKHHLYALKKKKAFDTDQYLIVLI